MAITDSGPRIPRDISSDFLGTLKRRVGLIHRQDASIAHLGDEGRVLKGVNKVLEKNPMGALAELEEPRRVDALLLDPKQCRALFDELGLATRSIEPVVQLFMHRGGHASIGEVQTAFRRLDISQVDLEMAPFAIPFGAEQVHGYRRNPVLCFPGQAGILFYVWLQEAQSIVHSHKNLQTGQGSHEVGIVTQGALREEFFRKVKASEGEFHARKEIVNVMSPGQISFLAAGAIHRVATHGTQAINRSLQAFWPLDGDGTFLQPYTEVF